MRSHPRTETWRLHWGAVIGGAVIAIAIGWVGELMGGLFSLFQPGTSSVWAWLGGLLTLAFWAGAAFAGGFVASRSADRRTRVGGMISGLVVWGVMGAFAAFMFALMGGNVTLLVGATAGAARLSMGIGILSLVAAFGGALLGGLAGQTEALQAAETPSDTDEPPRILTAEEAREQGEEPPPPSIH